MNGATVWRKRVRAWRASGKTAGEFAADRGFAEGTLRWWAWKLGAKAAHTAPAAAVEPIGLLRVVRTGDAATAATRPRRGAAIEIELGGARVSVGADADRAVVREVLEVLGAIAREHGR